MQQEIFYLVIKRVRSALTVLKQWSEFVAGFSLTGCYQISVQTLFPAVTLFTWQELLAAVIGALMCKNASSEEIAKGKTGVYQQRLTEIGVHLWRKLSVHGLYEEVWLPRSCTRRSCVHSHRCALPEKKLKLLNAYLCECRLQLPELSLLDCPRCPGGAGCWCWLISRTPVL